MSNRKSWLAVTIVILSLVMFIPVAQAQQQNFETRQCSVSTYNAVHVTPELGISSWDQKGIMQSTHESKLFDNWTLHLVGVQKRLGKKFIWNGLSKETGPDGEFIIWEFTGDSESGVSTAKPIYGTGKWKGVQGERKSSGITTFNPVVPLVFPFCQKQVGWIELPK
jgi:hypothetical protein